MLKVVAIEGRMPRNFNCATPCVFDGIDYFNPLNGDKIDYKEYLQGGNLAKIPTPIEIDDKYRKCWMTIYVRKKDKWPDLQDNLSHPAYAWEDDKWIYKLFVDDLSLKTFDEEVVIRTLDKVRSYDKKALRKYIEILSMISPHHPVVNALWVKTAPKKYRESSEQIARACLRGRVDEFEVELNSP